MNKQAMLAALGAFIAQRSGIDYQNYGQREAFMGDYRPILQNGKTARMLLRQVELRDSITADDLMAASRAFSGRLQFEERDGKVAVSYCAGQYFPTEYRAAACAVLARALWDYTASKGMPDPVVGANGDKTYSGLSAGEWLRKHFRRELGRSIANKWFN